MGLLPIEEARPALDPKMLRQLEPLVLVVGIRPRAIEFVGRDGEFFVHEAPDRLAALEQDRHVAAATLEHRRRERAPVRALPESWIEEAGVVDAKLAERRVDRRHLGGEIGRDLHLLARSENIKLIGIENQAPVVAGVNRLPEILHGVAAQAIDVDDVAVLDRPITDDALAQAAKIDPEHHAFAQVELAIDERAQEVPLANIGVVEGERMPVALLGMAAAEPDLAQFRPRLDPDAEAARRDLEPKLALVLERDIVERLSAVDDEASENVEPAGRAFGVCGAGKVGPKLEALDEPRDIDDAFLEHRPLASERHRLGVEALQPLADRASAPRQEARAHAIGFLADPQVQARRLELRGLDLRLRPDQLAPDHGADLLLAEEAERRREQRVGDARLGGVEDHRQGGSGRRQRTSLEGRFALVAP